MSTTDRRTFLTRAALAGGAVAAGPGSLLARVAPALAATGTVSAWGDNADGQLGNGTFTAHIRPAAVSNLSGVTRLHGGREHVIALKSDGTVWCWGHNSDGQVGDGTTT